jgi:hypothetical protein
MKASWKARWLLWSSKVAFLVFLAERSCLRRDCDLARQVIGWHHLVEIKGIKELALPAFPPTHHEPLPLMPVSKLRNHRS